MRVLSLAEAGQIVGGQATRTMTTAGSGSNSNGSQGSPTTTTTSTTSHSFGVGVTVDGSGAITGAKIYYRYSVDGPPPSVGGGGSPASGGGNGIVSMPVIEINRPGESSRQNGNMSDLEGLY